MSNIRIVYDNAADRATLSGSAGVSNLVKDIKSKVYRSGGTSMSVSAAWPSLETVGLVACAPTNLSPTATMRVRITREIPTTNWITGSETLSNAHGWAGASVLASTQKYKGVVPYVEVKKTSSTSNESRYKSIASFGANEVFTLTLALRSGSVSSASVGLFRDGDSWGLDSASTGIIVEGPASIAQSTGSLFNVTGLSATEDTLVRITRRFVAAGTALVTLYPGSNTSTNTAHSILATRVQVEPGVTNTSYYPTTTVAATRPLGYMDSWQSYSYDSGYVLCCPSPSVKLRGYTPAQAASAYAYGGGTYASMWIPKQQAYGIAIDIVDTGNLQGYVEAGRLIVGDYWEPSFGVEQENTSMTVVDSSAQFRTESGDMFVTVKPKHRKQTLSMPSLDKNDQPFMWDILWGNGITNPLFISLYPENSDKLKEQKYMLYGRLVSSPVMATPYFSYQNAALDIEEI